MVVVTRAGLDGYQFVVGSKQYAVTWIAQQLETELLQFNGVVSSEGGDAYSSQDAVVVDIGMVKNGLPISTPSRVVATGSR